MTSENQHPDVPDWKLERFLLGELPADEMARIREQVDGDPALESQLQRLRDDGETPLERYPAAWMAPQIERRAAQRLSISSGRLLHFRTHPLHQHPYGVLSDNGMRRDPAPRDFMEIVAPQEAYWL